MATKSDLVIWVEEAIAAAGGRSKIVQVAEHIWLNHESELRASEGLFYTWQYDMRWAATKLRREGKLLSEDVSPRGLWVLA